MRILRQLWQDQRGEAHSVAVILIYTIIGLGVIVGLTTLRDQIVKEYGDVATALEHLDQSYTLPNGDTFVDDVNNPATHFQDPSPPANLPAGLNTRKPPKPEGSALP